MEWHNGLLGIAVDVRGPANETPEMLAYLARSSDGAIFFDNVSGTGTMVNGTTVTVTFADLDSNGLVSDDDRILISVEPATSPALRGGSLQVKLSSWPGYRGTVIGQVDVLP